MKRIIFTFLLGALLPVLQAYALEESSFPNSWDQILRPFMESHPASFFKGKDHIPIAYRVFLHDRDSTERKKILLLTGRGDPMETQTELIYDLYQKGFDIYSMDARGQGASGRMLPDRKKGHVVRFEDYIYDLKVFMKEIIARDTSGPVEVVAHSMGAAIAVVYVLEHPGAFSRMVLAAPMFDFNLDGYPSWVVGIANTFIAPSDFVPGHHAEEWDNIFDDDDTTSSRGRFTAISSFYKKHQNLIVGGPTMSWVREALRAKDFIQANAAKVRTPILILQAENETIVTNAGQNAACKKMPHCRVEQIKKSKHDIFNEADTKRVPALKATFDFLDKN